MSMNLLLTIVIIYNWFIVNSVTVLIRKKRIYKREISSLLLLTQSTLTAIALFLIPVCYQPQHRRLNNQACSFPLVIPKGNWEIWMMLTVYLKSFLTFCLWHRALNNHGFESWSILSLHQSSELVARIDIWYATVISFWALQFVVLELLSNLKMNWGRSVILLLSLLKLATIVNLLYTSG